MFVNVKLYTFPLGFHIDVSNMFEISAKGSQISHYILLDPIKFVSMINMTLKNILPRIKFNDVQLVLDESLKRSLVQTNNFDPIFKQ